MPGVDFQSYLLASSPPGFDILLPIRSHFRTPDARNSRTSASVITVQRGSTRTEGFDLLSKKVEKLKLVSSSSSPTLLDDFGKDSKCTPKSPDKIKKKVSFADDLGHQLEYIRILTDSSDSPPCFRHRLISSIHRTGSDEILGLPPLKLTFAQPASDYTAFRERLQNNFVSLENVILKDYNMMGTIKVKNIAFKKTVKVRWTLDDWKSFEDVTAKYVHNHNVSSMFDTFSFDLKLDKLTDAGSALQFAIVYEVEDRQHWDNNNGDNYEVIPSCRKAEQESSYNTTDRVVFGLNNSNSWPSFCSWTNMDKSVPYW